MARRKVTIAFAKKRLGLMKKVKELTILCDIKACLIMFSPNEAEPMVWPSVDAASNLLDEFFAFPDIGKTRRETTIESYLKERIRKAQDQLRKIHKMEMDFLADQVMLQLHCGRGMADLNLDEIYGLLSFSNGKIMDYRKKLDFEEYPPTREPPVYPYRLRFGDLRITTDGFMIGGGEDEDRTRKANEATKRISIGVAMWENQSHYLVDQWLFPSSKPVNPQIHQTIGKESVSGNENSNPRRYLPYQGSSSNGNASFEMQPVWPPVMTSHGFAWSLSQPLEHRNIGNNPIVAMRSQPRQYPFEEQSNINNGGLQFHISSNIVATNNRQH